jgi:hypothetical protein
MDANSVRNMYSIIAITNKHTAKLDNVGSLYILWYNIYEGAWKFGIRKREERLGLCLALGNKSCEKAADECWLCLKNNMLLMLWLYL